MTSDNSPERVMTRHAVATLVYRATKTFHDAPPMFEAFRINPESRAPVEIIAHMGDLFDWALSIAKGRAAWHSSPPQPWAREVARFYSTVKEFDTYLAGSPTIACPLGSCFQGPIADAITHVGQLAMLRHLSGAPIRGENYFEADILVGRVGPDQSAPRREFS